MTNKDELTPDEAFAVAMDLHGQGRMAEAETLYRRILNVLPDNPEVLHMLGLLAHQCGHGEAGAELIRKALAGKSDARYWANLSAVTLGLGRADEAEEAARAALALDDGLAEAHLNLGVAFEGRNRLAEAVECFRRAAALGSRVASLQPRLGRALRRLGRHAEALECFDRAIADGDDSIEVLADRAHALHELARNDDAVEAYRAVLARDPKHFDAAMHLGLVYQDMNLFSQAETMLKWAEDLQPDNLYVVYNQSRLYKTLGRITAAIRAAKRAIAIRPGFYQAYQALGNACHAGGQIEEAIAAFEQGAEINPGDPELRHNIIACKRLDWRVQGSLFRDAYRDWNDRFLGSISRLSHANSRDPDRRLKLGYVSPDYRNHAVAYFLEPQLLAHDRAGFEVYCYSQVETEDAVTARFRALADHWRVIFGLSDDAVAAQIQADGIDILIDCAGHTVGSRMRVFARKPAPVQVTSLIGHDTTTGVAAIDYILSDPLLTPEGQGYEEHFTETLARLPKVVAPFLPRDDWPDVPPLPPEGPILFACFAEPSRIGEVNLDLWRKILDRVPGSRLLLKHRTFGFSDQARYWKSRFKVLGDDVELEGLKGEWLKNMNVYERVSAVLDSFPLAGATSSLIPLWMGTPVVSLAGHHSGQRYGATMLTNAGVPELVAWSQDEYVDKVVALATDRPRLAAYRRDLRDIMRASPILDAEACARAVEAEYRKMWVKWTETGDGGGDDAA